ncbi:MAG TPA: hypothetical protein VME69_14170, partial [Methylocella sp.]|nr:hypothetical protein [Methylocella sp.]
MKQAGPRMETLKERPKATPRKTPAVIRTSIRASPLLDQLFVVVVKAASFSLSSQTRMLVKVY